MSEIPHKPDTWLVGFDRDGGVSRLLEPAHKRRKLISGAPQNRKQVVDEAGHDAGMRAQHEHKAYDDDPADSPAHGYRSCDGACIPLPGAIRAPTTTARCSLLARFAVALETRLIQATYPQAPCALLCPARTAVMQASIGVMVAGGAAARHCRRCGGRGGLSRSTQ